MIDSHLISLLLGTIKIISHTEPSCSLKYINVKKKKKKKKKKKTRIESFD